MEFRLLGPLEVVEDGRVLSLGGAKQRAVLALLLLGANEVVSTDRLVEALWGDDPPPTAGNVVQGHVSHLRKVLAQPGREPVIATRPPGYAIRVDSGQLDSERFERLLTEARRARSAGSPDEAARLLREALALWRGHALAEFVYDSFAQTAIARLDELRLVALEERIEADLAAGRHAELVPELAVIVVDHPLRESLRGQLMLALYRSGRQAEALEAYQQARSALVDKLGIEPSPSLQELERAILRQDPALELRSMDAVVPAGEDSVARSAATDRSILVVPRSPRALPPLLSLIEPLAGIEPHHELLLANVLEQPEEGAVADIAEATAALRELRDELGRRDVVARVAVFTSTDRSADIVRLCTSQQVDLLVLDADLDELADLRGSELVAMLDGVPCDVALAVLTERVAGEPGPERPVLVPFGASVHDWAALELGCWVARAHSAPVRLLGTAPDHEQGNRDASRLLADVSLILQRLVGIVPEPVLAPAGADGILSASRGGSVVLAGFSERWREVGLGAVRLAVAENAPVPVLFVRRGVRPGALATPDRLTRFAWSVAGQARGR